MTEKSFLMQIVFNYLMFALFLYFTIDTVGEIGWGFFPILYALFATFDFVRGTRMAGIYYKIKKGNKS